MASTRPRRGSNPTRRRPTEPKEFLALLSLAKRVAAVRRRLGGVPDELAILRSVADELPDTDGSGGVGVAAARSRRPDPR